MSFCALAKFLLISLICLALSALLLCSLLYWEANSLIFSSSGCFASLILSGKEFWVCLKLSANCCFCWLNEAKSLLISSICLALSEMSFCAAAALLFKTLILSSKGCWASLILPGSEFCNCSSRFCLSPAASLATVKSLLISSICFCLSAIALLLLLMASCKEILSLLIWSSLPVIVFCEFVSRSLASLTLSVMSLRALAYCEFNSSIFCSRGCLASLILSGNCACACFNDSANCCFC